ncbi:PTK9 protein tyrosine kinase 9 [Strigomonas culicis]|uniref:PTK9 protein tyrosine kinase 9 n=1 Tax=Strigomonas culicis TaxID=28005 RepID=S9VKY5_9TRYP|nr:PTK9 protein tyrosine kinase 9 [Strigomonas culicis]|eukprot:EPY27756.1 PTK9 protein tyrosine kinase 9 [Strigomonas culicis]
MMRVNFKIDPTLQSTVDEINRGMRLQTVIAIVDNEIVKMQAEPFNSTCNLSKDCDEIRKRLRAANLKCAYIVLLVSTNQPALIIYVSDTAKPRDRMMYSTGSNHMQEAVQVSSAYCVQCSAIDEIGPELFRGSESGKRREDLMTESERMTARIAKMEVAPPPSVLPGVSTPITDEGDDLMTKFAKREVETVSFKIEDSRICADAKVVGDKGLQAAAAILPADHPRYVITRFTPAATAAVEKCVLIYVCPQACKPREKMPYASSKASFMTYAHKHGIKFDRSIEVSAVSELVQTAEDAFVALEDDSAAPRAPKATAPKGPRMLI